MPEKTIHLIGFGSQGSAWAQCLRQSGWLVQVYLGRPDSGSSKRAQELGFFVHPVHELPAFLEKSNDTPQWIAMLCPDSLVAPLYTEFLANLDVELRLVLAHGFALYTGELKLRSPRHQAVLLAPKAIGPKLLQNFQTHFPHPHSLAAAFCPASPSVPVTRDVPPPRDEEALVALARGLGFARHSLIPATFEQETIGDLISEQGLLCGGVFNLLEWVMESMSEAGVPDALIREECLTELELIAGIIREKGPADAFLAISHAAQCGTIAMRKRFEAAEFKGEFKAQMETVKNGRFSDFFQSQEWRSQAKELAKRLHHWQERLRKPL